MKLKIYLTLILLTLTVSLTFGQTKKSAPTVLSQKGKSSDIGKQVSEEDSESSEAAKQELSSEANSKKDEVVRTADNLKSGNYKDVLSSFFQLAAKDITGKQKSFAFSTTLFNVKAKADPKILTDKYFVQEKFARNLQFNFKLNLDSSYNFKGFTGGATLALVNQRDKQTAKLGKTVDSLHSIFMDKIDSIGSKYIAENISKATDKGDFMKKLNNGLRYFHKTNSADSLPALFAKDYAMKFLSEIKTQIDTLAKNEYDRIDKSWLWTIGVNGSTNKSSKLNSGSFNTILLKGDKPELDIRGSLSYADTVTTVKTSQVKFRGTAGLNFSIIKTNDVSLVEVKPYIEYNRIVHNPLPDEHRDVFLANADLRIKISKELWLPLTVKYDLKDHNFLGFLNVSFNMDGFK